MTKLGNKEILATLGSALDTQTPYGLSVGFDADGNPVMKIAPVIKAKSIGQPASYEPRSRKFE